MNRQVRNPSSCVLVALVGLIFFFGQHELSRWQTVVKPCHRQKILERARQLLGVQGLTALAGASSLVFVRTFQRPGPPHTTPSQAKKRRPERTQRIQTAEPKTPAHAGPAIETR